MYILLEDILSDWKSRKQGVTLDSNAIEEETHFLSGTIALKSWRRMRWDWREGFYPCKWQHCYNKNTKCGEHFLSFCNMKILFTWERIKPRKHHGFFKIGRGQEGGSWGRCEAGIHGFTQSTLKQNLANSLNPESVEICFS